MRRGALSILAFGAAITAATPGGGARADVLPIALDGCSWTCNRTDDRTAAREAAVKFPLSLCCGGRAEFDLGLEDAPAALLDGPPSPIALDGKQTSETESLPPYFDIDAGLNGAPPALAAGPWILPASAPAGGLAEFLATLNALFTSGLPLRKPAFEEPLSQ